MSTHLTYADSHPVEWMVTIVCDFVPVRYLVRRRKGIELSDSSSRDVDCFQFWNGETLVSEVVLPVDRVGLDHEDAMIRILHKILHCRVATVETDMNPVVAVFGPHG